MSTLNPETGKKPADKDNLTMLVLVVMLLLVFIMAARAPGDPDMWWHLRAGEDTFENGRPLMVDTMTFTRLGAQWVNHSWLGQLFLYLFFKVGGYLGLSLFVAILACATMLVLIRSLSGGLFVRAAIVILVCVVIAPVWSPRPQQFSLLLFAILAAWLIQSQKHQSVRYWVLPVLFVLWSNLHGGYSFGFILLGISLLGLIFDRLIRRNNDQTMSWREIGKLADWTAISLLAVLINPNGINTWKIPFQTVGVEVTKYIQEWKSIDFHQISSLPYLVLLFGCVIALGLSGRRATGPELFGLTLFGAGSLTAQRLIGIFAIFAAFVFARHLEAALSDMAVTLKTTRLGVRIQRWQERTRARPVPNTLRRGINLGLIALLGLAAIIKLVYVSQPAVVDANLKSYYPVSAVDYMLRSGTPGNILSDYGWGGYIDWKLRENKVFLDGRADLYSDALFREWMDLIDAKPGWQARLSSYQVKYILLPPGMQLVEAAQQDQWKILYKDDLSALLSQP